MIEKIVHWAARRYGLKEYFTPLGAVQYPAGELDFHESVGRGYGSNVILTPVRWVARNFHQAPLLVERAQGGEFSPQAPHPLTDLVSQPNPWYSGVDLWGASVVSWFLDGNSYWIKIRDGSGRVAELWYAYPWMMEPVQSHGSPDFITHYKYSPGGVEPKNLPIEDVVHFRDGIDPDNPRKGMSTLKSIIREVFTDDEASRYTAFILKNAGVIGLVVSPKESGVAIDEQAVKNKLMQTTTGPRRAEPHVTSEPVNVSEYGTDPRRMNLASLRNVTEERACAAVGIPAAVVGFGTGVQQTKVGATLKELKGMAWEDCLVPLLMRFQIQLDQSLLPDFETRSEVRTRFATEEVESMQESQDSLAERNTGLYRANLIKRSEARADLGWETGPEDEGYAFELEPSASFLPPAKGWKQATQREQQAIDNSPRKQPTEAQLRFMRGLEQSRLDSEESFAAAIEAWGKDFGDEIAKASRDVIKAFKPNGSHRKDAASDTNEILTALDLAKVGDELKIVYETEYLKVAAASTELIDDLLGLTVGLPDPVAAEIVALGGTQKGLIDLPKQTRKRLFEELTKAREEGLGAEATARRIRELVPAGPWKDVKTRAKVIARTETMNAQRRSLLAAYKGMENVSEVMIFDNRTGFGDEECTALDGRVVSLDVAQGLAADEHPNGTRSFAPVV